VLRTTSDINITENESLERNALHVAAIFNQPNNVSLLLRTDVNVHAVAEEGITPISLACMVDHAKVVQVLVEEGKADPNVRDWSQCTSLHAAAMNGHLEVTRVLLEHGADPWLSETTGWTTMNAATIKRHEEVVQMLAQAMEPK
jgi:ankyrin repeat protein